jgi:hypothetical protein
MYVTVLMYDTMLMYDTVSMYVIILLFQVIQFVFFILMHCVAAIFTHFDQELVHILSPKIPPVAVSVCEKIEGLKHDSSCHYIENTWHISVTFRYEQSKLQLSLPTYILIQPLL